MCEPQTAASAAAGSSLELQILRPHLRFLNQKLREWGPAAFGIEVHSKVEESLRQ
jgi:hypothetical protein